MAYGKQLNNKSFYANSQGASGAPDIAMPPLNETPAIAQAAPDPWQAQQSQPQNNPFGAVPDQLPQEVAQEMQQMDSNSEDTVEVQEQKVQQEEVQQQEQTKQDHPNFRSIREAKERAEQERDMLMKRMIEMEQYMRMQQQQQPQPVEEPDVDLDMDIDADALVEGKSLKKVTSKIKKLEAALRESQVRSQMSMAEAKLRSEFPDLDKVVTAENIATLNSQYPAIARSLKASNDMYDQASAAYTIIKNLGIYKDRALEQQQTKALANTHKPRSLASVSPQQGDSPLSKANAFANGFTDELKEQLRREMNAARRAM